MEIPWTELCSEALAAHPYPKVLDTVELPALPGVVDSFLRKSADVNVSAKQLAATLESDSGITCELLRHVNSASFGQTTKIGSVTVALSTLGLRKARTFVTTVGLKAAMASAKTRVINQTTFWNESLQRALFAREIARAGNIDGDISFLGALLQDFLLPVLAANLADDYYEYLRRSREEEITLCDYERGLLNCDHAIAAAHLARRWNLPDELTCCVFYHHQIPEIVRHPQLGDSPCLPVAMSALLTGQMRQVSQGDQRLVDLDRTTDILDLQSVCETVDEQLQSMADGNRVQFPLARRFQSLLTVG